MENVCPKCLTCRYLGKEKKSNDPFSILSRNSAFSVETKKASFFKELIDDSFLLDNQNNDKKKENEDDFIPKETKEFVFKCEKFEILNEMSKDFNGIHSFGIILKYPYNCSNYEFFELDSIEEI